MTATTVAPSDVVAFIDEVVPAATTAAPFYLDHGHSQFAEALLNLVEHLDPLVLPPGGRDFVCFSASVATVQNAVKQWIARGAVGSIKKTAGFGDANPIHHIRRILASRPDSAVPPDTSGLEFVRDDAYRLSLRADLASVETLIASRQWKAAIVLAGSLMEALLLDQLSTKDAAEIEAARKIANVERADMTWWHLPDYARVAREVGLIGSKTLDQVLRGGDFRNLVHPGKVIREGTECSRGSAMVTVGALFLVIEELG